MIGFAVLAPVCKADLAVGGRVGSMGIGIDIAKQLKKDYNLRISFTGYQFEYESLRGNITYGFELDVGATGLLVDWHPFSGGLRVTAGIYSNTTKLDGLATPFEGGYGIGDTNYSVDEVGELRADIDLGSTAPYIGFGWGYDIKDEGSGFALDIGILVQSSPKVEMTVSTPDNVPDAKADDLEPDLRKEELELEDALSYFRLFPVIMVGYSYAF